MLQRFEQRKNPKIPERQATLKLRLRLLTARRPFNTNILAGTQLAIKFERKVVIVGALRRRGIEGNDPNAEMWEVLCQRGRPPHESFLDPFTNIRLFNDAFMSKMIINKNL